MIIIHIGSGGGNKDVEAAARRVQRERRRNG
jgi:hypothetical protein